MCCTRVAAVLGVILTVVAAFLDGVHSGSVAFNKFHPRLILKYAKAGVEA